VLPATSSSGFAVVVPSGDVSAVSGVSSGAAGAVAPFGGSAAGGSVVGGSAAGGVAVTGRKCCPFC